MKYEKPKCSIDDCGEVIMTKGSRGWCCKHYRRWQRHGNPLIVLRQQRKPLHIAESDEVRRFWLRVDKTPGFGRDGDCWEWVAGQRKANSYGSVFFQGRSYLSHQVAWFLTYGKFSSEILRHTCDNPKCVNPDHLLEGTNKENSQDMVDRDRHSYGERHGRHILTATDVIAIKKRLVAGDKQADIARSYNVTPSAVRQIKIGKNWKQI